MSKADDIEMGGITAREYVELKIRRAIVAAPRRALSLETELDAYRTGHSALSLRTLITRIKAEEGLVPQPE